LAELLVALQPSPEVSGIRQYFPDIVHIKDDFSSLIARSRHADLLIMYGATWRNTWLGRLREMLRKRGARLRIVLAAVDRDKALRSVYARRLGITEHALVARFQTAVKDFKAIAVSGKLEIYTVRTYLNHAMYLFDTGAVLSLYSYLGREPTPALLTGEGELHAQLRREFKGLISSHQLAAKQIWPVTHPKS